VRPLRGTAWLGARATLAARRTRRFARWWLSLGGAATVVALLIPVSTPDPDVAARALVTRRATDTLRTAAELSRAVAAAAAADSTLAAQVRLAREDAARGARTSTDPRLVSLDAAIAMARAARTPAAFQTLAADPAVASGPRMRALADTLGRAARALEATPPDATTEREAFEGIVRRVGITIVAIAQNRRNGIAERDDTSSTESEDTVARVDSTALANASRRAAAWKDSVARTTMAHAAALAAITSDTSGAAAGADARAAPPVPSPGLVMIAVLVAVLALRFTLALSREARSPRLAHIEEAEAAVGAPVLAVVRDALPDGPMRFRPSGVDPFRVLYLGVTSTGTRARTLIVTGSDPIVIGAVGARLAIAAAADHRTTLVVDVDPEQIALARIFRAPPEPGFTDARAGSFRWREVARAVGSSDGLSITMISAGTSRDEPTPGEALDQVRAEFMKFREGFEFTIVVASLRDVNEALAAVPASPIVLCGLLAETGVEEFTRDGAQLLAVGQRPHGLVLWDAPRPELPSRAELAAHLSKQKGRTPGGSFQAVKRIIGSPPSDMNRPS
jgi:hypothetical protein